MDISKLLLNPARLRILQYISLHGEATAREVCDAIEDIPKATVYRHTKLLEENKILKIVKENRVRGAMEKVYRVDKGPLVTDSDTASHLATGYFIGLMQEVQSYLTGDNVDLSKDMVFFNTSILNVSDEEYGEMLGKIGTVLKEYMENPLIEGRKTRKLSMISSFQQDK